MNKKEKLKKTLQKLKNSSLEFHHTDLHKKLDKLEEDNLLIKNRLNYLQSTLDERYTDIEKRLDKIEKLQINCVTTLANNVIKLEILLKHFTNQ